MSPNYLRSPLFQRLIVATLALFFSLLLRALPGELFLENYYSRGFFSFFRSLWDFLTGWIPLPLFWVFWVLVAWAWWRFWCFWVVNSAGLAKLQEQGSQKGAKSFTLRSRLLGILYSSYLLLCCLIVAFLWMWGFSYGRVAVEDQIGFHPYQPSLQELRERVYTEAAALAAIRQQIKPDTFALTAAHYPTDLEKYIRPLLASALEKHGYPAAGSPRARQLYPKGLLLRWSTAGVYWPWVAEGHIDAGLHPLQKPAVMAHELAHAYGFGDEGTCSFWAFLAGLETQDPGLQYAFRFDYWRSIAARLRQADPEGYAQFRNQVLDRGIIQDLQAIYENNARYPDLLPSVRDATYSTYLKAQGIEDGLLNYGRVVLLVEGYLMK